MSEEGRGGRSNPLLRAAFGAFELDVRAGELRKHGLKIRLQEQPFQVLLMLLERPGEVVLREEIRKKLWPNDTIVEFAPSINAAIQRLRDALGDSADQPRYVETVARRGYRFIGELLREEPVLEPAQAPAREDIANPSDLTGRTISHYRVYEMLGRGGMGKVYRARDTKLGRDVAIKVLPEEFAQDADRMARFEREAQVLASLNHPNIAQIYGVEERALVMELVPGESLKGPLPLETALNYAGQIADALEAAHEKGIVHRDLKPANIMITPAGVVKILDFGLAAVAQSSTSSDQAISPTLTFSPTRAGMILGTAGYMSPEQARGKPVDKRADIWAFGVVLYEMLKGKQLFEGETVSDTLAAVLTKEPDWEQVPPRVRRLLQWCLQKDPKQRLRDIGDAKRLVEEQPAVPVAPAQSKSRMGWAVSGVLAVVAAAGLAGWYHATKPVEQPLKPLVRLDVDLGPEVSLGSERGADVILSPDGTRLVYVSKGKLFTRKLDQPQATELTGTDGAYAPFFSPDGKWVAFFAEGKLKKLSVEGGGPVVLCDASTGSSGGSWGEDGNIIGALSFFPIGTLSRVPSTGGTPTPLTELAPGDIQHRWPQVLPGAKAVLFTASTNSGSNIDVLSLKDRSRKTLQRGGAFGRYLSTSNGAGHLIYINNGTLFAVALDLQALEVRGTPVPVLDQVAYSPQLLSAQLDASQTGMLVYRSVAAAGGPVTVEWLDSSGKTQPLLAKPGVYARPRLSPDGQRLALDLQEGSNRDVWIYERQRDTMTRLTFDAGGVAPAPVWSPDGRYIAFSGKGGISWNRSDGAGKSQPLTQSKTQQVPWSFAPDGKRLSWLEQKGGRYELWTAPLESDGAGLRAGKPESFLQSSFDNRYPTFSPDGRWLAYASNESGTYKVYVRAFPDKGGKWQISNVDGAYPVWSRNGRELFFRGDNRIMVVSYTTKGDSFQAEKARVWSEKRLPDFGLIGLGSYDVAPDGKRVVTLMPAETPEAQQSQNHVIFLENFFDELRRKVPTGK